MIFHTFIALFLAEVYNLDAILNTIYLIMEHNDEHRPLATYNQCIVYDTCLCLLQHFLNKHF